MKENDFRDNPDLTADRLFGALSLADDRVSRLDERARLCGFGAGWRARSDVRAVIGAMSLEGELVHPEDLILHDLETDVRLPEANVVRAHTMLQGRRRAWVGGPELLSWRGVSWLSGRIPSPPPPGPRPSAAVSEPLRYKTVLERLETYFGQLSRAPADSPRSGIEAALAVLDLGADVPALLASAALLEAWRVADPQGAFAWVGPLLAAVWLRASGRFGATLLPLEAALCRRRMPPRLAWEPLAERLAFWVDAHTVVAELEMEELIRLGHQRTLLDRRASETRRGGRAPRLSALALDHPVLTTELIARSLDITPQASLALVRWFGPALHEITGRSRYRVWRL